MWFGDEETTITATDIKLPHRACISDLMLYKMNNYTKKAPFLSQCHRDPVALYLLPDMPFMERWQGHSLNDFFQHQVCLELIKTHNYSSIYLSGSITSLPDDGRNFDALKLSSISDNIVSTISFSSSLTVDVHCNELYNNLANDEGVSHCLTG